jgi:Protein of unknown function (DUF1573)
MKKLMLLSAVLFFAIGLQAQKTTGPVLTWEKVNHDFGEVVQGDKVEHTYKFTNTGNEPLIITNVVPSCGCTLPKSWPRDPIMPGGSGEIVIAFNSSNKPFGKLERTTQVVSNANNSDAGQFKFTAMIIEKKQPN